MDIQYLLDEDETILFQGKPRLSAMLLHVMPWSFLILPFFFGIGLIFVYPKMTQIITNKKIIKVSGSYTVDISILPLEQISNITFSRGLLAQLMGTGNIYFTVFGDGTLPMGYMPEYEKAYAIAYKAWSEAKKEATQKVA